MVRKKIVSNQDGLNLEILIIESKKPKGIVQIAHGMSEHKERYIPFMKYLANLGYTCIIHDHRGHGNSILKEDDLGYFYDKKGDFIIYDLKQVHDIIKKEYPNLPILLFSHSMGTLVSRSYLKRFDDSIDKLILCGPPYNNKFTTLGKILVNFLIIFKGDRHRSLFIQKCIFNKYNSKFDPKNKNSWISSISTKSYDDDPKCGFIFTLNGFYNLFCLIKKAFSKKGWTLHNKQIPIFIIAGEDDPVIGNQKQFKHTIAFLQKKGYHNIKVKLYKGKRHDLLNENNKEMIYNDIYTFINKK